MTEKTDRWVRPLVGLPVAFVLGYAMGGVIFMIPGAIVLYESYKPDAGIFKRWAWYARLTKWNRSIMVLFVLSLLKIGYVYGWAWWVKRIGL